MELRATTLKPGDQVDRYTVREPLGSGGMGAVFRAYDSRLQRHVALKILHPDDEPDTKPSGSSTGGAARILREARAAAALEHPNVIAVYDVGEVQEPPELRGTTFLAMELIRGHSLRPMVGKKEVPVTRRLRWLVDVARALAAAHDAGLIHRDIKPENVMLREDGVIKVLDFGIAKRAYAPVDPSSSTEASLGQTLNTHGVAIGTPYYMSPEQMRREPLDGRTDQFSWGVLAYEILTGVPPWSAGADALQLVAEVLTKRASAAHEIDPAVPSPVSEVIARTLEKSTAARFATMHDVIAALEPWSTGDARPQVEVMPAAVAASQLSPLSTTTEDLVTMPRPLLPRIAVVAATVAFAALLVVAGFRRAGSVAPPAGPPVSAPSPPVARMTLVVRATPADATIQLDDGPLLPNPHRAEVVADGSQHRLTVRAPGAAPQTRTLVYDVSQSLELALVAPVLPVAATPAAPRPGPTAAPGVHRPAQPAPPPSSVGAPIAPTAPGRKPIDPSDPYKE